MDCDDPTSNLLCRACLEQLDEDVLDTTKHHLFLVPDLAKKFCLCTSLSAEPLDEYSKYLCEACYQRINEFHRFRLMCVESAQRYGELLSQSVSMASQPDEIAFEDAAAEAFFSVKAQPQPDMACSETDILHPLDRLQIAAVDLPPSTERATGRRCLKARPSRAEATAAKRRSTRSVKCKYRQVAKPTCDEQPGPMVTGDGAALSDTADCAAIAPRLGSLRRRRCGKVADGRKLRQKAKSPETHDPNNTEDVAAVAMATETATETATSNGTAKTTVFQCDLCPTRFFVEHRLIAHKRTHEGLVPYPCPRNGCGRSFNRWHCLSEHLKQHEGVSRAYVCDEDGCGKVYKHKPTLVMHLRKCHKRGPELKSHVCEICGKIFKASAILNDHRYTHKDKSELPYACDQAQCHRRFSNKEKLKVHLMRHAGIKNFVCPYCGMRKTTKNELKIHINYHTLERTWPCRFCAHVCNSAGNLKMHVRTVHERAKDYACGYCERSFAKPDTRKYHEMTHTGEKPNECGECGKRFTQPAALRTHKKIHQRQRVQHTAATRPETATPPPPPPPPVAAVQAIAAGDQNQPLATSAGLCGATAVSTQAHNETAAMQQA